MANDPTAEAPNREEVSGLAVVRGGSGLLGADFKFHRSMERLEWEDACRALALLNSLNAHAVAGTLEDAFVVLRTESARVLSDRSVRMATGEDLRWSKALDDWLAQYSALRQRFTNKIGALGQAAESASKAVFQKAYENQSDFRLVWELRNVAQHGFSPLAVTKRRSMLSDDGHVTISWSLKLEEMLVVVEKCLSQKRGSSPGRVEAQVAGLASLWNELDGVEMASIFESAMSAIRHIMATCWNDNADQLEAAIRLIEGFIREVEVLDGSPALMRIPSPDEKGVEATLLPMSVATVEAMRTTLALSREAVSRFGRSGELAGA